MSHAIENNDENKRTNEKIYLITNIFHNIPNFPNNLLPLVSSPNNINVLYSFLNYNNENSEENSKDQNYKNSIITKIELLNYLKTLFQMNNNLIYLFIKKCKSNIKSFFDPLIDIYLNEYTTDNYKKIIEELMQLIIKNVSTQKSVIEYIYQKMSVFFRKDAKRKLTESLMIKYLNLLDLFYNCSLDNNDNNDNNDNKIKDNSEKLTGKEKEIKNFIYLNGLNSKLSLILNNSSSNLNTDYPTLENGFSFIFWINLNQKLIESFFLIHKDDGQTINLITINYGGSVLKLQLLNLEYLILVIDDNIKSSLINISTKFKYDEWNSFSLILYSRKAMSSIVKTASFKLYINNSNFNIIINYPQNYIFPLLEKIKSITLFENLIGKITSVLFFGFGIEEDKINTFLNLMEKHGFYKIKYLYKFLLSSDKEYSHYSRNKYIEKFKNNLNNIPKIFDIELKGQNIKNLMCVLCPFCYDNKKNQIDDIFGNYIGVLSEEDGVNNYINYYKNIKQLGGMNNLLPIAELMLLSQNKNKNSDINNNYINFKLLDKHCLTENTFLKYLIVIKKILTGKKLNLFDANNRKFFSSLGLFLEKFPSRIYTPKILNIFLEIGKEAFQYNDDKDASFHDNFVNMILLNEKIFSKFTDQIQQQLWEGVHKFFTSYNFQIKDSISISKICLLLRFYDSKRYDKFCCKNHADLFMPNEILQNGIENNSIYKPSIMKPEMKTKINKLFETIQIYMDKLPNDPEIINLFKLLSLDLSPCLQTKIIQVYKYYFENKKINNEIKSKVFDNLVKNNFFDIFEYALSISLLDVRIELIDLLKILNTEYKIEIENYSKKKYFKLSNFLDFIGKNLLPIDLQVEIDVSKDNSEIKTRNTIGLSNEKELEINVNENNQNERKSVGQNNKFLSLVQYKLNSNLKEEKLSRNLLINYFNNEIYEKDINSMWKILNNWLIDKPKININKLYKQIPTLQINSHAVTFCIEFVSKSTPSYIDTLLIILYSFLKNESIINRDVLYTNKSFYPWLIETIYYFYDKDNWIYFNNKDIIELILQHSIELLKEFISIKRPKQENEARLNYIFDYAYSLKSNNDTDENNVNKLAEITRLILSIIMESSKWNINLKTKFCFEFMIFFKNSEKYYKENFNVGEPEEDENDIFRIKTCDNFLYKKVNNIQREKTPIKTSKTIKKEKLVYPKSSLDLRKDIQKENNIIEDNKIERKLSNNIDSDSNKISDIKNSILSKILIPECIYDGLFLNKIEEESSLKTLKEIWKDFNLYDYIIDNYKSNIWGIENLCKKVKMEYKGEFLNSCKDLIKLYNPNNKYKNILLKDLYKCLNFASEIKRIKEEKEKNRKIRRSNKKLTVDFVINKREDNFEIESFNNDEKEDNKIKNDKKESKIKEKTDKKKVKEDKKKEKEDKKKEKEEKKKEKEEKKKEKEVKKNEKIHKKNKTKDKVKNTENKEKEEEEEEIDGKNEDNEYNDINVLNINLILLCLAIDLTKDKDEKEFFENIYQQFLLFCILCTLNVSQSEKFHEFIQIKLYDLIGYGLLFLKQRDEEKYHVIIKNLIVPIFEDISKERSKLIKNIFGASKINIYRRSALYELFILGDKSIKNSIENSNNLRGTLTLRTKIKRTSTVEEENMNNMLSLNLNENNDKENIDNFICDVIYEQGPGKKGKIDDNKKLWVTFVGDSDKLKRHIINSTIIYYISEKKKKYLNEKIFVKFKNINKNNTDINPDINYELQFFYNINEDNGKIYKKLNLEKNRMTKVINNLIPFFENQIKKYSNTSFIQEKKRRNIYKSNKKRLFSWKGFWSERYIFYKHPEYLKFKIKNHLTKEMTKILLTPILDIEYYMPQFSKFNAKNLFNEGDYKYKVNLDIDDILNDEESEEINETEENVFLSKFNDLNFKKNYYGFNYLECIYKLTYNGLWDKYKNYYEQKFNFENNTISNITRAMSMTANIDSIQNNFTSPKNDTNVFECCLVKLTHHIKGHIKIEKLRITFIFNQDNNNNNKNNDNDFEDDPTFDKDMGACFGSTFKHKKNDKDKINLSISIDKIQYFFIRNYFYQETGLEIYTVSHKNYYFNFKNNFDLHRIINDIIQNGTFKEIKAEDYKGKKTLGYEKAINNNKKKNYHVDDKILEWRKYKISTLEYIMWMNIFGGRSLNDLTQYPVFPWLITDYSSDEINYEDENKFRNLFLPMGMLEINDKSATRKETFIDTYTLIKNDLKENFHDFNYLEYLRKGDDYYDKYKNKKSKIKLFENAENPENEGIDNAISSIEISQLPSYYGSHYSNPTYVTHFLTRIFPFSCISIEIQGDKFDDPNRMFLSIFRTFESASTQKDDIRELIPEFYTLPEIFQNKNNLNLAQGKTDANNEKIIINDVELPPWSDDLPSNFITEKRKLLEKSNLKINKWIDIIFGSYQRGEKAEEIHNLYKAQTYERMVKIDNIRDIDMRNALMRLVEVGMTPMQILNVDSKPKIDKNEFLLKNSIYSLSKGNTLDESNKLISVIIESQKYNFFSTKNYENQKNSLNKDVSQVIEPIITKIICINPKLLKVFINNNYFYTINLQNHENKGMIEESNIFNIENISTKYAPNCQIINKKLPFIIYQNGKYIIKGGFWDSRLEINSIPTGPKEEAISTSFDILYGGPISTIQMSDDEKYLLCGTKLGYVVGFTVKNYSLDTRCNLSVHNDEITSISINDTLNMFATASMDGYIMLYILPSFILVGSIQISKKISETEISEDEYLYANNVFLSSSPLPCIVAFISLKKLFKIFSINGSYISEVEESENTTKLNDPLIFKSLEFQEFLIYGTDDGYIKIRSFPNMNLINMIKPFEGQEIVTLGISPDKRYCFAWSHSNKIVIIKDTSVTRVAIKDNNKDKDKTDNNNEQIEEEMD